MLRIHTPLSAELEKLIHDTIGCCIAVHRGLGCGLVEKIYSRAVPIELMAAEIGFEREKRYQVHYRGQLIAEQCLDLVIQNSLVVEIKAVEQLAPIHHAQILSYMRIANVRAGLLINFNVPVLPDGIKRKIL